MSAAPAIRPETRAAAKRRAAYLACQRTRVAPLPIPAVRGEAIVAAPPTFDEAPSLYAADAKTWARRWGEQSAILRLAVTEADTSDLLMVMRFVGMAVAVFWHAGSDTWECRWVVRGCCSTGMSGRSAREAIVIAALAGLASQDAIREARK